MSKENEHALSTSRRRRGVVRASLTRLDSRVAELEGKGEISAGDRLAAQRFLRKLDSLDSDFKSHHFAIVDLVDGDSLEAEQGVLDEHDDKVADLAVRMQQLAADPSIASSPSSNGLDPRVRLDKRLGRLERELELIASAVDSIGPDSEVDSPLLRQYEEQLSGFKAELTSISHDVLSLDGDEDGLSEQETKLNKIVFGISLKIKRLLQGRIAVPLHPASGGGLKLPKLDVPAFDGSIINWRSFWEQFTVTVHDRSKLSNSEKLTYLRHALKDGSAKQVVEGLSSSGEQYEEAIDCLRKRFDRPRLLHQAHVRAILEAPALKDGNGKELRRLHDIANQHLRALKAMECEPSGSFVTSMLELKLDVTTMFEWQKHSQEHSKVPHFTKLLEFLDLRAQASESSAPEFNKRRQLENVPSKRNPPPRSVTSFTATVDDSCVVCKVNKHPLYACQKFKSLPHEQMVSAIKGNGLCMNCLRPGHFVKQCASTQRCRRCQKPHHTLLHLEVKPSGREPNPPLQLSPLAADGAHSLSTVVSHVAQTGSKSRQVLLMTCRVSVRSPDGHTTQARALLDSASSTSFISERLAQHLHLSRSHRSAQIAGIAGISHQSLSQSVVHFSVTPVWSVGMAHEVEAMVLPKVTSDLPLHPVPLDGRWQHLWGLQLADPESGSPGNIDVLLGADVFSDVLLHGRRSGPPGSPTAIETCFGWVLAGAVDCDRPHTRIVSHHASVLSGDDLLRKFWEVEELSSGCPTLSPQEQSVVSHFQSYHRRDEEGRFVVPLPRKPDAKPLGESRSQAVRRFLSLERSLRAKDRFQEFGEVIDEYLQMNHAELVPSADLERPREEVFYLPMHAVVKESSSTTKIRAVFDASAKSSSGVSLNDQLLIGPTVHSTLVDVLLRFRRHRVALTTDVSRMYRAVLLPEGERDLHRFMWRSHPGETLRDYRMTRVTFGVSSSSFAANMSVKQTAIDHTQEYPLGASAVHESFYVDDGLVGANSLEEAVRLQEQLQELFARGGFLLRKWKSSEPAVLRHLPASLLDSQISHTIPDPDGFAKTLGIEWSTSLDCLRLTVAEFPRLESVTKRALVSDVAKTYDVLGWFAPSIIKVKILLQRLWEAKVGWDDPAPDDIRKSWEKWRLELPVLTSKLIARCYFPRNVSITSTQLHGFSDASEDAYAGVVYLRMVDTSNVVYVSLVMAKTRVAPIKRLTIPRLELCGANLLANLLDHIKRVLGIPSDHVYAWTDSTVVLGWLSGNPRRFKMFVGNRVSNVMGLVPPDRWQHVRGDQNPADSASRGLFPSELLEHRLWWDGPEWLYMSKSEWPANPDVPRVETSEEKAVSLCASLAAQPALPILESFSSFTHLKRVTAWIFRFVNHCRGIGSLHRGPLSVDEVQHAERYWLTVAQESSFTEEMLFLKANQELPKRGSLLPLHPFLDSHGLLRVGGRESQSKLSYSRRHPIILPGNHTVTKLIVRTEHLRLLHGGPTLVNASLSRHFHIIGGRRVIRSVTRACVTCRRLSAKPQPQMLGQLPVDRLTPGSVFERVGVDYAGPMMTKRGSVRKPTLVKAYVAVFVSLSVKAVHLELVSDLTTEAFLAALRRFIARRGKPFLIWSDHGTNFVGAARELKELFQFLGEQRMQQVVSEFCTSQDIRWKFIPERGPHFGGLWEAAVKSMKTHLKRIVADVKLTFEELTTVLTQIESCLNSRPLTPLPDSDDGIEALTPGHFLVGRPLEALPDPFLSFQPNTLLRRWHLCQALVRRFWQRWSSEYLSHLNKFTKWNSPSRNFEVGDLVCLREDGLVPTKWPLARVVAVHPGADKLVRVVTVKTRQGTYRRPVTKVALLLATD